MLIVVIYHCILFWTGTWFTVQSPLIYSSFFAVLSQWMNTFHIYGFVLVSGYLFFYLKYEKGSYLNFLPFISNKAKRLLIPYVFIATMWVMPVSCLFFRYTLEDIIKKYILGISPSQLWFLLMLFIVFMIFYPLSDFFKKNNIAGIVLAIVFYGIGFIGQAILPNIFQVFRACTYIPFFYLGFKIRQYGSNLLRKIPSMVWILADIILFVLMRILSNFEDIIFKLLYQGVRFLLYIVGALMAFIVLQKLAERIHWEESRLFGMLSRNSMPVYLIHQQIIYIFIYHLNGIVSPYIHAGINFFGTMVIAVLVSILLMKFKWTRFLLGEK